MSIKPIISEQYVVHWETGSDISDAGHFGFTLFGSDNEILYTKDTEMTQFPDSDDITVNGVIARIVINGGNDIFNGIMNVRGPTGEVRYICTKRCDSRNRDLGKLKLGRKFSWSNDWGPDGEMDAASLWGTTTCKLTKWNHRCEFVLGKCLRPELPLFF